MPLRRTATGALALGISILALASTGAASPDAELTVVAKGLNNPRGLEVAPSGAIYVAEAGTTGKRCVKLEGDETCSGLSGSITRIENGKQTRVATGFLSAGGKDGSFAVGIDDVAVGPGGKLYAIMSAAPLPKPAAVFGREGARQFGKLLSVGAGGKKVVADIRAIELKHNPDRLDVNPNPYGVVVRAGTPWVVDAGGNTVLEVRGGRARVAAILPALGKKQIQSVPTSVTVGPDGALYVGELGGDGLPQGKSRVWRVEPGKKPTVHARGFNPITGVAFDAQGNLYVAELVKSWVNAERKGDLTGGLIKVAPDGTRTELAKGKLQAVGGVAVGADGAVYVSTMSVMAGAGQVVRVAG